jgi:hypothetical protein
MSGHQPKKKSSGRALPPKGVGTLPAQRMAAQFQAERDAAIAQSLKAEGELKKFTDDRALLAQDLAEARAERDLHKAALEKAQADLRDTLVDLSRADTGQVHAEAKRDRLAVDALAALAEAGIATPEEGYVVETHCLSHDIATLARERDTLAAEAAMQREALEGAVKILSNPAAPIAYLSHYGPKINAALATPSQGAEWLAGHDKKTRADELARCEIEWNEATAFASQPKTPSMREIIDAHDTRVRRETLEEAARAIIERANKHMPPFARHDHDGAIYASLCRTADAIRALAPRAPETAPAKPSEPEDLLHVPDVFVEISRVVEQPQNLTAVRERRWCAMPRCKNIEDPRWGGYCDGHSFEAMQANNERLAKKAP